MPPTPDVCNSPLLEGGMKATAGNWHQKLTDQLGEVRVWACGGLAGKCQHLGDSRYKKIKRFCALLAFCVGWMHLEQQDLRSSRIRAQAMRNRNHETSPTEPTKRKEPGLPSARLTFVQRKTWKPASHQAKPNQKVLGERLRKSRTAAGFVPKPCETATTKTAETLPTEPTKRKEKELPSATLTFVQRKTWRPASHQAKPNQKVLGERLRKSRTAAGFVPKPCETATAKSAETSPTEPTKRKEKELPSASRHVAQQQDSCSSRIRAQAMRNRNHKNCRNVAYGTH